MIRLTSYLLLLCSFNVDSKSHIEHLNVQDAIAIFTTTENKTGERPACVTAENTQLWAFSIASNSGRAKYSLLMTAMATGQQINVESANDCAALAGTERPARIYIQVN